MENNKLTFILAIIGCCLLMLGIIVGILLLLIEKKEDWSEYDSYILGIFWSPASCFNFNGNKTECFERLDKLDINKSFIIHGLWPAYTSGDYIGYCNNNTEIDVKFNEEKEKSLSIIWPGLWSSDYKMWKHEYNKHGYCYIKRLEKDVKKEYDQYFDKTSGLFNNLKYLMEVTLPDTPQGLHAITKSKFKEFIEASSLKIKPSTYSLRCLENKLNNSIMLSEIWFNYDFDFNPTTNFVSSDNCPERFDIYFRNKNAIPVWEKYDFYVLTGLWGPTSCREQGKECYKMLKKFKERDELNILTVHGLWPSYASGIFPQWCNLDTNIKIIKSTEEMNDYWINMFNLDNEEFWEHEYNKHGLCYNQRFNFSKDDYLAYFNKTISLYKKYNLKNLLKEFYPGIFAGVNRLNRTYIQKKLDDKFGPKTTAITCKEIDNVKYLYEIRLKLDLNFNNNTQGTTTSDCPLFFYAEFLEVEGPKKESKDFYKEYDMYFFTILWLGTTCHQKGWQCYDRIQNVPKNTFTVHGLWPNLRNGTLADFCNGANDIEIEIKDKELFDFMKTRWISGYHTNEYFWGHEYNKHGYCFNQRNNYDVNDYEIYFQKSKDMFIKNNFANLFLDFFKKEKIEIEVGDMAINRTKFEKFFKERGFDKDYYVIVCANITKNNGSEIYPHISEMRIRYDLDFKLLKNETDKSEFDCPEIFYAQFL